MNRPQATATVFLILLLLPYSSPAQLPEEYKSIHQLDWEFYRDHPEEVDTASSWAFAKRPGAERIGSLSHVIYGFQPYWVSDATAQGYEYDLLTHVAYFSADVDTATGGFTSTHGWASTQAVNYARDAGKKVHLTVTFFSGHDRVLFSAPKRQNLVNNILAQLSVRSADGVNIDFESMSKNVPALADSFRTFIVQLGSALRDAGKELTVELPANPSIYFNAAFFEATRSLVDSYFLMAYAYYWKGSSTAGPVSPLTSGTSGLHVMRSIDDYLSIGCPPSQLIAGFPYYGIDWPVVSATRMSATTGSGSSRFYNSARAKAATLPAADRFFDGQYNVPWYRYEEAGQWRQTWYDDSLSLSMKYDSVKTRSIAGIGIWALGYDAPYGELWGALAAAFLGPVSASSVGKNVPDGWRLAQNYPNPFNGRTTILFSVDDALPVSVRLYDILGRCRKVLFDGLAESGRTYAVEFESADAASGVYVYALESAGRRLARRMILSR